MGPKLLGFVVALVLGGSACGDDDGGVDGEGGSAGAPGATQTSSSSGDASAASSESTTGLSTSVGKGGAGGGGAQGSGGEGGVAGDGGAGGGQGGSGGEGEGGAVDCGGVLDESSIALSRGHADVLAVSYLECDESLRLHVTEDTGIVEQEARRATQVLIHGGDTALVEVPDERFAFLGSIGQLVHLFPEGQPEAEAMGVTWPGYQAYGVQPGVAVDDEITVHLDDVEGPGNVFLFGSPQDELSAPTMILSPSEGLTDATFFASTHSHMNWAFTEPGLYRLSFRVSMVRASDGRSIASEPTTYRFLLGELSTLPTTEPTVLELAGAQESYTLGETLSVTAVRHGAASARPTTWLKACDAGLDEPWVAVAEGEVLTAAAEPCWYRAEIVSEEGQRISTSQVWLPTIL